MKKNKRILIHSGVNPLNHFSLINQNEETLKAISGKNTGNFLFTYSIFKFFKEKFANYELISDKYKYHILDSEEINNNYDLLVIPAANWFSSHFIATLEKHTKALNRIKIPVLLVGIGAQGSSIYDFDELDYIRKPVYNFCKAVLKNSTKIGVRGYFTAEYLKRIGIPYNSIKVIGCPSIFLLGKKIHNYYFDNQNSGKITVNLDYKYLNMNSDFFKFIKKTTQEHKILYISQDVTEFKLNSSNKFLTDFDSFKNLEIFQDCKIFFEIKEWISFIQKNSSFSFGTKIHGNLISLISGIPAHIFFHDSRTREMAEYLELPRTDIKDINKIKNINHLLNKTDFSHFHQKYLEKYNKFIKFMNLSLQENKLLTINSITKAENKINFPVKNLITIITVVQNNKKLIERCIKSVLNQTYKNIEYIIIDGGSTDGTLDIIKKYEDKISCWISKPDKGIYDAMNKGLEIATGKYIAFLNSDDYYFSHAASSSIQNLIENNLDISYAGFIYEDENKKAIIADEGREWDESMFIQGIPGGHETFFVKKACYDTLGYYDTDYKIVSDYNWIQRAFDYGFKAKLLKKQILVMRLGGVSFNQELEKKENYDLLSKRFHVKNEVLLNQLYSLKYYKNWFKNSISDAEILNLLNSEQITSNTFLYQSLFYTIINWKQGIQPLIQPSQRNNKKIKIVIALTFFSNAKGGAEKIAVETANALYRLGYLTTVISCHGEAGYPAYALNKNIPYIDLAIEPYKNFYYELGKNLELNINEFKDVNFKDLEYKFDYEDYKKWWNSGHGWRAKIYNGFLNEYDFDVVLSFMPSTFPYTLLGKSKKDNNTIHIAMLHNSPKFKFYSNLYPNDGKIDQFMRLASLKNSNFISILFDEYINQIPVKYKDKVFTLPNFTEDNTINSDVVKKEAKVILSVGRLSIQKNQITLLESYKNILNKYPDWKLKIFGEGPLEKELKELCEKLKLSFENIFCGIKDDLTSEYKKADIFILPSHYEGFPLAMLEAMSYGVACIGYSDCEGVKYLIKNNINGILTESNNAELFAQAIENLILNRQQRIKLGEEAKLTASLYTNNNNIKILDNLIRKHITTKTSNLFNYGISLKNKKIIKLCTYTAGGAGVAAKRLQDGLNKINQQVLISGFSEGLNQFVQPKSSNTHYVHNVTNRIGGQGSNTYKGNTLFSPDIAYLNRNNLKYLFLFDIIHLHWIVRLLSVETIAYLSHFNKPIVWTFHDKNPLTGGCHYFHGCEGWKTDCMNCPQLIDNYDNYPAKVLTTKKKYINFKNITVVVLNQHFKTLVKQSPLFNESRIEVIPNGIDTEQYKPIKNKIELRQKLELPKNKKILLYIVAYASTVKGYKEFCQTAELLKARKDFHLLLVGSLPQERDFPITHTDWGHVKESSVIDAYNVADITVLSSVEDNLPNVMLESLSCGTPVVGFKVGGLPDMITDGYNGYTVEIDDCEALADRIIKVLDGEDLSKNCREYAEQNLRLDIQAKRYEKLYEDLLKKPPQATGKADDIPEIFTETAPTMVKLISSSYEEEIKQQQNQIYSLQQQIAVKTQKQQNNEKEVKKMVVEHVENNIPIRKTLIQKIIEDKWFKFGLYSLKHKVWIVIREFLARIGFRKIVMPLDDAVNKSYQKAFDEPNLTIRTKRINFWWLLSNKFKLYSLISPIAKLFRKKNKQK